MRILCIGISHKTAGVELRERLAFDPNQTRRALEDLASRWLQGEFVLLSTCNRTEIYTARPLHFHPRGEELRDWLLNHKSIDATELAGALYTLADMEAASHLFAVSAGLDSLVAGEPQIVAQVKEAYRIAGDMGTARSVMNSLFQSALHTAKHIRAETPVSDNSRSIASMAGDLVVRSVENIPDPCILSIGAGKMSQLTLQKIRQAVDARLLITNRSAQRANELAASLDAQVLPFEQLTDILSRADAVVCSTGSNHWIITAQMVLQAQQRRLGRRIILVDIAVPRDIEPSAAQVPGVSLYNIDDLAGTAIESTGPEDKNYARARQIINHHAAQQIDLLLIRPLAPTIEALYRKMESLVEKELESVRRKLSTHDDADSDLQILRRSMRRTIRRILHPFARNLRRTARTDAGPYVSAIRKLFELDELTGDNDKQ